MFLIIVSWVYFIVASFLLIFILIDQITHFSLSPLEKKLQDEGRILHHYFTPQVFVVFVIWTVTGWYIFS